MYYSEHFIEISPNTDALRFSFITKTVIDWNNVPASVIGSVKVSENPARTFAEAVKGGFNC